MILRPSGGRVADPPRENLERLRSRAYENYDSAFKREGLKESSANALAWSGHHLRPLLHGLPRDAHILELGCGTGGFLEALHGWGYLNAEGVDVSPEQVALARERGVNVTLGEASDRLDCQDRWHAIVALDVLEHFTAEEGLRLLERCSERLVPGGRLLLQTPNGGGLLAGHVIYGDVTHVQVYSPSSLTQLLRLAGFVDVTTCEASPRALSLTSRLRAILWGGIAWLAAALYRIATGKTQHVWTETMLCLAKTPYEQDPSPH
jgi:2-polyprenyl-3-methyl-5-hydroxy-6-metoxy-1,4-benzoquinol methylase